MTKFIDMEDQIIERLDMPYGPMRLGLSEALAYLDRYPDQVPGRTITRREFDELVSRNRFRDSHECYEGVLRELSITVIPDPEPTNGELIERKLRELREEPGEWMTYATDSDISGFSQALDAKGVKAPGGDDE